MSTYVLTLLEAATNLPSLWFLPNTLLKKADFVLACFRSHLHCASVTCVDPEPAMLCFALVQEPADVATLLHALADLRHVSVVRLGQGVSVGRLCLAVYV